MDALLAAVGARLRHDADGGRSRWHDHPAGFAVECVDWPPGDALSAYQADVLGLLASRRRVAVRSLHGAGKTTTAALVVLWFAVTRELAGLDWKAVTTAGGWRQLERYLWPEIAKWARRLRWDVVGMAPWTGEQLMKLSLRLVHGQAFAAASDDPQLLEGAHAAELLIVLDEAKAIGPATFDALEGALSGTGNTYALATSTPGAPEGRFFDIHARRAGLEDWETRHVTLSEATAAGRVSAGWAEQRRRQWGESSALFLNRVLGEFATSEESSVIPLAWVEAAVERWYGWDRAGRPAPVPDHRVVGVDVARSGPDDTVLAAREGPVVVALHRRHGEDTMTTAGRVAALLAWPWSVAVVDVVGVGAGVGDRLRELGHSWLPFSGSARPTRRDRSGTVEFHNLRAQAWWRLREMLDPEWGPVVALPDDEALIGDLCAPRWTVTSAGRVLVEAKDEVKRRLGRSPDAGDAVVMAFAHLAPYAEARPGPRRAPPPPDADLARLRSDPTAALAEWAADVPARRGYSYVEDGKLRVPGRRPSTGSLFDDMFPQKR